MRPLIALALLLALVFGTAAAPATVLDLRLISTASRTDATPTRSVNLSVAGLSGLAGLQVEVRHSGLDVRIGRIQLVLCGLAFLERS